MNLPAVFPDSKKRQQGFTLVELLLVTALMLIVGVFMFPLGISFYRSQMANEAIEGIQSALRRAQTFAITGKSDSSFGIKFFDDSYVLFEGESYDSRNSANDEIYTVGVLIEDASLDEVVFELFSGLPSASGYVDVSSGEKSGQVEVTSAGRIQ
jgi:prepilin-type N-terminal cleavage/methylation domain-containing protein